MLFAYHISPCCLVFCILYFPTFLLLYFVLYSTFYYYRMWQSYLRLYVILKREERGEGGTYRHTDFVPLKYLRGDRLLTKGCDASVGPFGQTDRVGPDRVHRSRSTTLRGVSLPLLRPPYPYISSTYVDSRGERARTTHPHPPVTHVVSTPPTSTVDSTRVSPRPARVLQKLSRPQN